MALPEFGGTLGLKRAAHLLRRATFGATKQKIDEFAALTPAVAVTQLYRQSLPDPILPIDPKTGTEWVISGITSANSKEGELDAYFINWFLGQMMSPGISSASNQWLAYSAREKIVMFLHTHFTAIREKVNSSRALYFQNQLYRMFALDATVADPEINFKTLSVKVCVDNSMLRLLDGNLNVKGSVNENYSRELLELYSIGRGLAGSIPQTTEPGDYYYYTEADVQTAARILSGWDYDKDFNNIDPDTLLPRGRVKGNPSNATSHDNDTDPPKQFSNRFVSVLFPGNIIEADPLLMPGGVPTEASAIDEITKLIDLIYEQNETSLNICRKIYRFFVWAPHTEAETMPIESAIISEMANTFRVNGFKIQPVIENLLRSQHFYEAAGGFPDDNFGSIIKSPLDLVLGTLRFFDFQLPDMQTQTEEFYAATDHIRGELDIQGMKFYEPYDVAGYDAYHQYPLYHRYWITPNSLTRRYDFARSIVNQTDEIFNTLDVVAYIQNNFAAQGPNSGTLVTALIQYLFPNLEISPDTLTTERVNYFKERLLNGFPEGYYWTVSDAEDKKVFFRNFFNSLLQSPEYQLA